MQRKLAGVHQELPIYCLDIKYGAQDEASLQAKTAPL